MQLNLTLFSAFLLGVTSVTGITKESNYPEHTIQHFSVEEGLSQSTVYAICQDYLGFMWFGTRGGGLNRFDGHDFTVFQNRLNDSSTISDNEITAIFEDADRNLWIGTRYGGVNRYLRHNETFIRYNASSDGIRQISDNSVKIIFQDRAGKLWVGTNAGLNLFDKEADTFNEFLYREERITEITSMAEDDEGNLIVLTRNYMLVIGAGQPGLSYIPYENELNVIGSGSSLYPLIEIDNKKNIWIGTAAGLYLLESLNSSRLLKNPFGIPFLENRQVRSLIEDKYGNLWIGTLEGLLKVNPQNSQYTYYSAKNDGKSSLRHNSVRSIFEDNNGNIWVGTWGGGVTMISSVPGKFKHVKHYQNVNALSDNIVSSFLEDDKGLWIGTELGGLNYLDYESGLFSVYLPETSGRYSINHRHIKCLYEGSNGEVWIGTFGGGLNLYNRKENRFYHYLTGERIYSITEYPKGTLWVGGISGLYSLDLRQENYGIESDAGFLSKPVLNSFVTKMMHDARGNLWVGTVDNGLHLYNRPGNTFISFRHDPNDSTTIPNDYIISMALDASGNFWVGTNNGICRFDYRTLKFIRTDMAGRNPDNVINGIVADDNGGLWISSNKGLLHYQPESGDLRNYDLRDGLQSNEFNRGAYYKSKSGEIFFGGINGYNHFHPAKLKHNDIVPAVVFTGFRLFEQPVKAGSENSPLKEHISETQHITLNYKQSVFGFNFVALNYIVPEKNKYMYQLKGYDDKWVDIQNSRTVTFMNLRHGDYILHVVASNNDEVWNMEGATVRITILPPPWLTNWAYFIYMFLIIGLIWLAYRLMVFRIEQKNILLNERLENERNEDLNQMKLRFFTNISHEFRTPLTLISAPLDTLMNDNVHPEEKNYNYRLIKDNILRLKRLVDQLMDFRKAEHDRLKLRVRPASISAFIVRLSENFKDLARRKEIEFKITTIDNRDQLQWIDPDFIDKILFNILSNAFKYTPAGGRIGLDVTMENEMAVIKITDTGVGIDEDELPHIFDRFYSSEKPDKVYFSGTGIGLAFSKRLVEIHHGEIFASSIKDKETVFTIVIPVGRASYTQDEVIEGYVMAEPDNEVHDTVLEHEMTDYCPDDDSSENPMMLIAEDNEDLSRYLRNHFHNSYRVLPAKDGVEAFQLARENIPDIIISDVIMSNMDGFDLCAKIRENILTSHIPVVLLTALTSTESRTVGMERGADAYVEKPFEIKYLESVINNLMLQRANLKEKFQLESRPLASYSGNQEELRFLGKVEEIVMKNISKPEFSVTTLCAELSMSRSQLFRKFRAMTGKSPKLYIQVMRLKRAAELMLKEGINVNEVTFEVGFTSPSHFITSFKKYFGKTPKEYVTEVKG
jgi:signal transduction histidine kinase/ligand-binding sensor domain-containing protein/DNA-binding response OmpR family regulator